MVIVLPLASNVLWSSPSILRGILHTKVSQTTPYEIFLLSLAPSDEFAFYRLFPLVGIILMFVDAPFGRFTSNNKKSILNYTVDGKLACMSFPCFLAH